MCVQHKDKSALIVTAASFTEIWYIVPCYTASHTRQHHSSRRLTVLKSLLIWYKC